MHIQQAVKLELSRAPISYINPLSTNLYCLCTHCSIYPV